ncbi:MAG: molybdopterin molybdotransferase MoeA [bacterium]|nr:molybdopterin molybdotransferase MoeA [bacterium]
MFSVSEAQAAVLASARPFGPENRPIQKALGLTLAQTLAADRPLPPFNRVTMDGYALQAADLLEPGELHLIGQLAAGVRPEQAVEPGTCIQVMTGAPLPEGADAVIPVEDTEAQGEMIRFKRAAQPAENWVPKGSEAEAGAEFFKPGRPVTPSLVAYLASIGKAEVDVFSPPKLVVISTGTELVPTEASPEFYQIRDCNSPAVLAQAAQLGLPVSSLGIAPDEEEALKSQVRRGLQGADILILSGGVSMGEFDLVPKILKESGIEEVFHKVRLKPGKPIWFGRGHGKWVFGLPGNPVSVQVCFKLFVEPLAMALSGRPDPLPPVIRLPLLKAAKKRNQREQYTSARLVQQDGQTWVEEVQIGGSGDFSGLAFSEGLFKFDADLSELAAGTLVDFIYWRRPQ